MSIESTSIRSTYVLGRPKSVFLYRHAFYNNASLYKHET